MIWLKTTRKKLRPEESLLSVGREFYFNVRIIAQHMVRPISKLSMDLEGILKQRVQKRTSSVCVSLAVLPGHRLPYGAATIQMKKRTITGF